VNHLNIYNYVKKVINISNSLKPNLIALTGNIIDGKVEDLKNDIALLVQTEESHDKYHYS